MLSPIARGVHKLLLVIWSWKYSVSMGIELMPNACVTIVNKQLREAMSQ